MANSLNGKAASIKIIELPGLPEKGDVSDWLKDGDSKEKLLEICGKTPFWSPDSKQLMPAPEQVLSTISISELLSKKFEKTEGIIDKGILPEGGGLLIVGESEVGKSLITLEWAIHLSIGRSILDGLLPVPKARRLCIFQCEIPLRLVKTRLNRILSGLGIKKPNDSIFLAKPEYQYNLSNSKCIENMIRVLIEREAEVFIVDPLSSFHTENENDNTRMRFVLDRITNICRRTGAATIVVHHFGKPVDGRNESYRVRGASSIKDWCDTLITITPKAHEHKTLRTLTFEKLRHGKKIRPILLERDNETFVHAVTEEDMIVTPKQIQEMLVNKFNGRAEKQSDLVEAVIKNYNCTDKTVRKAIDEAVNRKLILKQKRGRQAILTVLENSG